MMWKQIKPYLILMRFPFLFYVFIQFGVGVFIAISQGAQISIYDLVIATIAYPFLIHGGTLTINSFYDRDEDSISFVDKPPKPPKYLAHYSYLLYLIGLVLAYTINLHFFITSLILTILFTLYSAHPVRLKERPPIDIIVGALGYAPLTLYAGFSIGNVQYTPAVIVLSIAMFFVYVLGGFFSQMYQIKQDKKMGVKTFATIVGKKKLLRLSLFIAIFDTALVIWFWKKGIFPELFWIAIIGALACLAFIIRWFLKQNELDPKKQMYVSYTLICIWNLVAGITFIV